MRIDEMCRVVEQYIYYCKQVVVRIEIRYDYQHLDKDIALLQQAYNVAIHNFKNM